MALRPVPIRVERSAGGVVIREVDGVPCVLVIRDPYKNWGLPKGHLEDGESVADAALREVAEETGLTDLTIGPELLTIDWYFRSQDVQIHKFTTFFLMDSARGEPVPEAAEGITECLWVPLAEAADVITYENARDVVRTAHQVVAQRAETSSGEHG